MNMLHMMNHHNTTETMSNVMLTGWDVVIMVLLFILLLCGGIKVMEWMLEKTYEMKEPWGLYHVHRWNVRLCSHRWTCDLPAGMHLIERFSITS